MSKYYIFTLLILSCSSRLGHKDYNYSVQDLSKETRTSIGVELERQQVVYKREMFIEGYIQGTVLLNQKYVLSNNVDTSFSRDWYQTYDSLIILPMSESVQGELNISYRFYFQNGINKKN